MLVRKWMEKRLSQKVTYDELCWKWPIYILKFWTLCCIKRVKPIQSTWNLLRYIFVEFPYIKAQDFCCGLAREGSDFFFFFLLVVWVSALWFNHLIWTLYLYNLDGHTPTVSVKSRKSDFIFWPRGGCSSLWPILIIFLPQILVAYTPMIAFFDVNSNKSIF